MEPKIGIHVVIAVIQKGWSTAVAEAIEGKAACDCMIFYGANIPSDQKSLMGIKIREENELIITLVSDDKVDEVLELIRDSGNILSTKGSACMAFPLEKIYLPDEDACNNKDVKDKTGPGWKILGTEKTE